MNQQAAPAFLDKIVGRAQAAARVAGLQGPVVFTNGVFDVLHRGHVTYLAAARALGAHLVVGLNTDASARRLGKGPDRPLNTEADRAVVLAALESVSLVTFFDEDTPVQLLSELKPQVYVKGGDYDMRTLAETALVEDDDAVIVPQGARHNVRCTGSEPLKMYTIYGPPEHIDGTVHRTPDEAKSAHEDGMQLVKVDNLGQVVDALHALSAGGEPPRC